MGSRLNSEINARCRVRRNLGFVFWGNHFSLPSQSKPYGKVLCGFGRTMLWEYLLAAGIRWDRGMQQCTETSWVKTCSGSLLTSEWCNRFFSRTETKIQSKCDKNEGNQLNLYVKASASSAIRQQLHPLPNSSESALMELKISFRMIRASIGFGYSWLYRTTIS